MPEQTNQYATDFDTVDPIIKDIAKSVVYKSGDISKFDMWQEVQQKLLELTSRDHVNAKKEMTELAVQYYYREKELATAK